jgi:hypothetical protein
MAGQALPDNEVQDWLEGESDDKRGTSWRLNGQMELI